MSTELDTPALRAAYIEKHYDSLQRLLANLYDRWLDEGEHENWDDYVKAIRDAVTKAGGKMLKAKKRPFGCVVSIPGLPYDVAFTQTATKSKWEAVSGKPPEPPKKLVEPPKRPPLQVGDIVVYSREFRRSTGQHYRLGKGKVLELLPASLGPRVVLIEPITGEGETPMSVRVLESNLILEANIRKELY